MKRALLGLLALSVLTFGCTAQQASGTPTPRPQTPATSPAGDTGTPTAGESPLAAATPGESPTPGGSPVAGGTPAGPIELPALPGKTPPRLTQKKTIKMTTDAGDLLIEVYPEAAPNAVARFLELVEKGFYDDTPVFRVVKNPQPFVAQFGINWRGDFPTWQEKNFKDDPSLFKLERGTLAFAKGGPDTNSTQVFINYTDNSKLASPEYNFTTFGKVVEGMDIADSWKAVGDPSMGLDQGQLWSDGEKYLKSVPEKPNMIVKMEIVD
ncbi:MAG: peptidylprolyl isomerase [Armatimonadetes bacterium]|nr:peptidylprolyl isomerase [Armatimonadota bacterium]